MTHLQTNDRMPNAAANHAPTSPAHPTAAESDILDLLGGDTSAAPAKSRRNWWLAAIGLLLTLGATGYFVRGSGSTTPTEYKTTPVTRGDITQSVTANGQIAPIKTVTVGSQVSGIITRILVDYNSPVTNGQVIAQIDPSTYEQSLIQAEADMANAQAALSLAQLNHNRSTELLAANALPRADYESTEVALQQAQATVKSREAALKKAQVDLERTTIYSPIDGIVITRAVDFGQTVAASLNAPTLFTIAQDLKQMHIEAAVSEADIGGVTEGQTVNFTVDAYPNHTFNGLVTQVRYEASTNQNVVNYTTIVDVNNDDLRLRPGMTANATIITAQRKDVLRLPNAALRFKPAETAAADHSHQTDSTSASNATKTVYVANNTNSASLLRPTKIATGISDSSWTEVVSGLHEGERVATGTAQAGTTPTVAGTSNPFSGGMRPPR
ncbi:MAG TPA: efflux RND transporter periplasmic adaptor subunit [Verrucomicrobiota bacterium]|nr:efflux RND transporter periplasmic adaptor subunit [Verrucomicrobiota bacterium]HNT15105.1 efflux RND transporter periplasmic adaptor subunit [Verrucomicrobiota bacterium]